MKYPKLPDKVYDVIKWMLVIFVPAFIVCFRGLANTWQWDIPVDQIVHSIELVAAFLGAIIGLSAISYKLNQKAEEDEKKE